MPLSEAHRRAHAKYDSKRPKPISLRLTDREHEALERAMKEGESKAQALKRLAFKNMGN